MERRVTQQDVSWFLDALRNGQLDLEPPYQRRSVWTPRDRRFFLDTVFHDYPSPPLFLHKNMEGGVTKYAVVDGKQRLESIFMFFQNKLRLPEKFGDARLDNKRWSDLKDDPELTARFYNYVLPVEMVVHLPEPRFLNEVFDRLNRNSRKLTEQELRHAKYDGWFATLVEEEAKNTAWADLKVRTFAREKRMSDVQIISELFMIVLSGRVRGFDHVDIEEFYAEYDELQSREDDGFDEEADTQHFGLVRNFLREMVLSQPTISERMKFVRDLYTLFGCVALSSEILALGAAVVADRYVAFMLLVDSFATPNLDLAEPTSEVLNTLAKEYFLSSAGASTDLPQRESRHKALTAALLTQVTQ